MYTASFGGGLRIANGSSLTQSKASSKSEAHHCDSELQAGKVSCASGNRGRLRGASVWHVSHTVDHKPGTQHAPGADEMGGAVTWGQVSPKNPERTGTPYTNDWAEAKSASHSRLPSPKNRIAGTYVLALVLARAVPRPGPNKKPLLAGYTYVLLLRFHGTRIRTHTADFKT